MVTKYKVFLSFLFVFSVNTFAGDIGNVQSDLSAIKAAERQHIIDELTYRLDTQKICKLTQTWTDKGSGADVDGYFFIPPVEGNFYMIGGYVTQSRKISNCVIVVSEPQNNPKNTPTLLVAPVEWKMIWNDKGSGADKDGSMWKAIPPDSNYKCLGSIPQIGYRKPVVPGYRCVHVSLTEKIVSNSVVWSDTGSHADKKVTMLKLPNSNSFVAIEDRVSKIEAFDLKVNPVVKPDPKLVEEKLAMRMEKIQQDLEAGMKEDMAQKQLAEEAERKRLAEEAEQKRLAEETESKRSAEKAEQQRLANEKEQKKMAEAAEKKRLAEAAERKHLAEQVEQKTAAEEEHKHATVETEQKPIAETEEQDRVTEEPKKSAEVTYNENTAIEVDEDKSTGVNSIYILLLKISLLVLGVFIFLGFIIYKFMKDPEDKA